MRYVFILLVCAVCSGCKNFIDHNFVKVEYPKDSVGALLNDRFMRLVKQCSVVPQKERNKLQDSDYVGHRYLPSNFTMDESELNIIPISQKWHGSLMFLYPFTESEKTSYLTNIGTTTKPPALDPHHIISEKTVAGQEKDIAVDIIPKAKGGIDGIVYKQSCASYVSSKMGAGASFPIASVQAALEAQYSNGGRAAVSTGYFDSPFAGMIRGGGAYSRYANLLVWESYNKSPDLLSSPALYILEGFEGAIVMSASTESTGTKSKMSASIAGGYGPASGSASVDARYEQDTEYSDEHFLSVISGLTAADFHPLKRPAAIASDFSSSFAYAVPNPVDKMIAGTKHEHSFKLAGVPTHLCESGDWEITSLNPSNLYSDSPIVYGKSSTDPASGLPECTFAVVGTPSNAITLAGGSPTASYILKSKNDIKDPNPVFLELQVTSFPLAVNPNPQLIASSATSSPSAEPVGTSSGLIRWHWGVQFDVVDKGNPIDRSLPPTLALDKIVCPSGTIDITPPRVIRDESTQKYTLDISSLNPISPPVGQALNDMETCKQVVKVSLQMPSGVAVERPLTIVLDVHRPVAVPAPPVPAPPVPAPPAPAPPTPKDVNTLIDSLKSKAGFIHLLGGSL